VRFEGEKVTIKEAPVPVKGTVCMPPCALSVTVSDALSLPKAVGVKVTLMVQLPFAPRDAGQLLVCAKFPLMAMLLMVSGAPPVFERITV